MTVNALPKMLKTLLENDRVRVSEFRAQPGEETGLHLHPSNVIYPFTDGLLKLTFKDGRSETIELKTGEPLFRSEEWHSAGNVGQREVRALVVDLK